MRASRQVESMDMRHRAIALAFRAMTAGGLDRLASPWARGRGAILTLHHVRSFAESGFEPNRILEITPEFLDQALSFIHEAGIEIVDLDEAVRRITQHEPSRFFVVLTFDDAYRDNRDVAQPILSRHNAPWTMFVTTGFADRTAPLWWRDLERALRMLRSVSVTVDGKALVFETSTNALKSAAFTQIYWLLRGQPEAELRHVIAALAHEAGFDPLADVAASCMDWDELRVLAGDPLVTFGAHTLTHPMLAKHPEMMVRDEMVLSKARIEAELGRPVMHLSYPVGDSTSAGPREFALAGQAGFASAVTTRPGHVDATHAARLTALPRISLNGLHQNLPALRAMLSGLPFLMMKD
jgi:peptidoglycan/xylan/chitin deacetylase (PgdA/CDA1 family)